MSIVTNAMTVNLQVGLWAGHRLDREATRKVTQDAGADSDAARVNKHLVPKESFKDITSTSGAVRTHFYAKTLPWKDNGDRLLTRAMFADFVQEHERLKGEFIDAVDRFLDRDYPAAVERAGFRMGDLFDVSDYPPPDVLRRKFYINLDIDAVTQAGDFRVEMEQDQVDDIRAQMEAAMQARIAGAMTDVWGRLAKVVGHFADKMGDADKIFRDSTVENLTDLVDVLPGLNMLNDPDLEAMRQDIKVRLCGLDPKDLRKDKDFRAQAAGEAKEILDRMSGFMNAFSKA